MKSILAILLAVFGVWGVFADTQSDWYAGLTTRKALTRIQVGDEKVWVDRIALPYRFAKSNAVLHSSLCGYRLELSNTAIASSGSAIWSDGDIAVLVNGENMLTAGDGVGEYAGIYSQGSVLVFGEGALSIRPYKIKCNSGIYASRNISIVGANVTVSGASRGLESWSGDILASFSTVGIYDVLGAGVYTQLGSLHILGAAVSVTGQAGFRVSQNIVIDAGAVNMLVKEFGTYYYSPEEDAGVFSAEHSYLSMTVAGEDDAERKVLSAPHVSLDNCVGKLYSDDSSCIYADDVAIGEGDYQFVTRRLPAKGNDNTLYDVIHDKHAVAVHSGGNIEISGGNIKICAPRNVAFRADGVFEMKGGLIEVVGDVNVKTMMAVDAALAASYGIASSKVDLAAISANFYSQIIVDAVSNLVIGKANGSARAAIHMPNKYYIQSGGTVWCDDTQYGVNSRERPIVNGGSFCGGFTQGTDYWGDPVTSEIVPCSVTGGSTNLLVRFEYVVPGVSKYGKITRSWSGILPSYYGTGSLYADAAGKLYFWVPEAWNVPSGGFGGGTGGGGSGSSGNTGGGAGIGDSSLPDLTYYLPSGWSQPVFVATGRHDETPVRFFEEGTPVYLKYAFKNTGNSQNVSNFIHRFTLNSGTTFQSSWVHSVLECGKWGWPGDSWMPDALQRLPPGTYNLTCELNATKSLTERDYSNNTCTFTFTVVPVNRSNFDLAFVTKSGCPAPVFITNSSSGKNAVTEYNHGDYLYLRYSYRNIASEVAVSGFKLRIDLDGKEFVSDSHHTDYSLIGGETACSYLSGVSLAKIGPGRHTFTLTLDPENLIEELNEGNNTYSVLFSVKGNSSGGATDTPSYSGYYTADRARTLTGAVFNGDDAVGVMALKIGKANKKGVFKIGGTLTTLDGKKHSIRGVRPQVLFDGRTYYDIMVKDYGAMSVKLYANGFSCTLSSGWTARPANISSLPSGDMVFRLDPYPGSINGQNIILTQYLPQNLSAQSTGTKLKVAAKAGKVIYKKGVVSVSKGGEPNPSGLKLSYSAKAGTWRGSFNIYSIENGKLKKYAAKITGVTIEGQGYGVVTFKKLTFTPQIKAWLSK